MNKIKKEQIVNLLFEYCDRYESQKKAALSLKDVSASTVNQMLNRNWELISDQMWRNVAAQIGYRENPWELVETHDHRIMKSVLRDAKANALVMAICGSAGTGKSFTIKHFQASEKNVFALYCNEFWNKKNFMSEILMSMGRDYKGLTVGEMMHEVVHGLKTAENPILIFDEADKLSDAVLYNFISLYNQVEDECGIILCATNHLEKSLRRGVALNKKGYNEIWSRIGRKCIMLKGVSSSDIVSVCEANGVTSQKDIQEVIKDSEGDLRRVKRKIHAIKRRDSAEIGEVKVIEG
ncbi:MAG: ATP-binding protein [Paludibacter sp.]|jgi:DNA transposition AAA+ family ATPase|nr:ATP-binding protein [Paludibacter sp.]